DLYNLSLHDALPIWIELEALAVDERTHQVILQRRDDQIHPRDQENVPQGIELAEDGRGEQDNHASRAQIGYELEQHRQSPPQPRDRKSTRLNSSHVA